MPELPGQAVLQFGALRVSDAGTECGHILCAPFSTCLPHMTDLQHEAGVELSSCSTMLMIKKFDILDLQIKDSKSSLRVGPFKKYLFLIRETLQMKKAQMSSKLLPRNSATSWGHWVVASGHRQPFASPQWKGRRALSHNTAVGTLHGLLGRRENHRVSGRRMDSHALSCVTISR